MNTNVLLFIFIAVIAVVLLSESVSSALLVVSIVTNYLIISKYLSDAADCHAGAKETANVIPVTSDVASQPAVASQPDDTYVMYGKGYQEYHSFDLPVAKPTSTSAYIQPDYTLDNMNVALSRQRARDKRCMTGFVSKTADYYRHNYGDELSLAEAKPWWGNIEY